MSSDKTPLMAPNQQYSSANIPDAGYSGPPQYNQPYHYPHPSENPAVNPWKQGPIVSQPHVQQFSADVQMPRQWSSGLCDCCKKPGACVFYFFCSCLFNGNLAKRMGASFWYGCCCGRHLETISRPFIRARHNISGTFCDDCWATTFYGACSSCQIDRELDRLGYP